MSRRRKIGPWHYVGQPGEPGFLNSYTNYGTPYIGARFRKDPETGLVRLGGLIANAFTFGVASDIFVMPAGFLPVNYGNSTAGPIFNVPAIIGTNGPWRVDVLQNGEVILQQATGAAISYLSLDSISYYAN